MSWRFRCPVGTEKGALLPGRDPPREGSLAFCPVTRASGGGSQTGLFRPLVLRGGGGGGRFPHLVGVSEGHPVA